MNDYIERSLAIQAVTRAKLPDTTPEGVPIANGKRSVTDCVRRIKEIPSADVVAASWTPATTPPDDERNVFICHGRPDFKTVCIGYYDHENHLFYEDRNWFASILYDPLFWCEMPKLPVEGQ